MLSFSLSPVIGLFRCRFVAVTPVMVTQAIPSTMLHYFCLLTGIALRTSLGVGGNGGNRTPAHGRFRCLLLLRIGVGRNLRYPLSIHCLDEARTILTNTRLIYKPNN